VRDEDVAEVDVVVVLSARGELEQRRNGEWVQLLDGRIGLPEPRCLQLAGQRVQPRGEDSNGGFSGVVVDEQVTRRGRPDPGAIRVPRNAPDGP
jgi:hypothetical protein